MPSRFAPESALAERPAEARPEPSPEELLAGLREVPIGECLLSISGTLLTVTSGKLDAGDLEQARSLYEQLVEDWTAVVGREAPRTVRAIENFATTLQAILHF